jgi:hypothetical protein
MKVKTVQRVICLAIFFLFANFALAEDWVLFEKSKTGHKYYDKSSIKVVNPSVTSVWIIKVYNKDGKAKDFSWLKKNNKAPNNADILSCVSTLVDFDCINNKVRITASTIYDKEKKTIYYEPIAFSPWRNVIDASSSGKLKNMVCKSDKISKTKKKQ